MEAAVIAARSRIANSVEATVTVAIAVVDTEEATAAGAVRAVEAETGTAVVDFDATSINILFTLTIINCIAVTL